MKTVDDSRKLTLDFEGFFKEVSMLSWALTFFIFALVAAFLGFGGIAASASSIAQILFYIFVLLFAISLLKGLAGRGDKLLK